MERATEIKSMLLALFQGWLPVLSMLILGFLSIGLWLLRAELKRKDRRIATLKHKNLRLMIAAQDYIVQQTVTLRRPLQGLVGIQDLFTKDTTIEQMKEYFDIAAFCSNHIIRQLDRVQFFAETTNNKDKLQSLEFSLQEILHEGVQWATKQANASDAKVHINVSPEVPQKIMADRQSVLRLITELVNNSLIHANHGSIHIDASMSLNHKNTLKLTLVDKGPGLSDKFLRKLNSSSLRLKISSWNQTKNGMGLHLIRNLVDSMNGQIHAESQKGQGTQVMILIPLEDVEAAKAERPSVKNEDSFSNVIPMTNRPLEILIVDDDLITLQVVEGVLNRLGVNVTSSSDSRSVVHMCREKSFDLVLLDLQMPFFTGQDIARQIFLDRTIAQKPLLACLSSENTFQTQAQCREIGFFEFVSKPATAEDLRKLLADAKTRLMHKPRPVQKDKNLNAKLPLPKKGSYLIDVNRLFNSLGENLMTAHSVLHNAKSIIAEDLTHLSHMLEQEAQLPVRQLAHKLRGELAVITCERGAEICKSIETSANDMDWITCGSKFSELCDLFEQLTLEIENLLISEDLAA